MTPPWSPSNTHHSKLEPLGVDVLDHWHKPTADREASTKHSHPDSIGSLRETVLVRYNGPTAVPVVRPAICREGTQLLASGCTTSKLPTVHVDVLITKLLHPVAGHGIGHRHQLLAITVVMSTSEQQTGVALQQLT